MEYKYIGEDASRVTINAHQCYQGLLIAREGLINYRGGMYWKSVSGTDYLIRDFGSRQNRLGKRSDETAQIYLNFCRKKTEASERFKSLMSAQTACARACIAAYAGRVPLITAQILRKLADIPELNKKTLIVGTNALFAYESAAAVHFSDKVIATGDVDILLDTRKTISLAVKDPGGFLSVLKSIDKSFEIMTNQRFRAQNKTGFMVDLIQPTLKDVMFSNQTSLTDFPDDLSIVEIKGLDWLVSCPKFNATAIDIKGFPVPITAPDPRAYAMHKLWLSAKDDRNPLKKDRDISQARAVFDLVTEKLSFLKFNEKDLQAMPFKLRDHAAEDFGFSMNF